MAPTVGSARMRAPLTLIAFSEKWKIGEMGEVKNIFFGSAKVRKKIETTKNESP